MPEMKLYNLIKHMERATAQYFKKPSWVENRSQLSH